MEPFRQLIKEIKQKYNQKVVLIAHSLGGVLVETYMRLYSDWQDDIQKFIALAVPFDGCNAQSL
jgi:alpha-beta hydrolase superfamily lysophospholipase